MNRKNKNLMEPISFADSERYHEKLTVDGFRLPDPYYQIEKEKWCRDLSELPFLTFPDIFVYCVMKKGIYNCEEIQAYRSLEAFIYFESGHVQGLSVGKCRFTGTCGCNIL